ncbi:transcriptional regulator [Priestia megaterium]|uniref:transcriptional regulator n=1 Tax=Priestia megaterium TaxID=1404 RepID=UPI002788F203|nr:transcriptional regulator [Priestia megaterium]MDQ0808040.1 hypothetical protein [Priestia megaterium]
MYKARTKFGHFIDMKGYTQKEIIELSKLGKNTVTKLCSDSSYRPRGDACKKIISLLKKIDKKSHINDFFDM